MALCQATLQLGGLYMLGMGQVGPGNRKGKICKAWEEGWADGSELAEPESWLVGKA